MTNNQQGHSRPDCVTEVRMGNTGLTDSSFSCEQCER